MPRTARQPQSDPARLLPVVAAAFAELGYRRATTARLARRCGVRENVLYRAWPDKKAMFLASIDYVLDLSLQTWGTLVRQAGPGGTAAARAVLDHASAHHGELGLYRIVFAGLSETDDSDVRAALRRMYQQLHRFIAAQIRAAGPPHRRPDADVAAWTMVGVGTMSNISRELNLFPAEQRKQLFQHVGRMLLEGPRR